MLRSSIYVAPAIPMGTPTIDGTDPAPLPGYVCIGTLANGHVVLHAVRGAAVPDGATVLVDGSREEWGLARLQEALAAHAQRVLEAEWVETISERGAGRTIARRGKVADIPTGATPTATDLLPHVFAGEQP